MANEVAIPTRVELDEVAGLLAEHHRCLETIKKWEERRDELAAKIQLIMGDSTIGTVAGKDVVTYERVDRFQGAKFKKEHPDLYEVYTDTVAVQQFNVKAVKMARPDLYEAYQVRSLRNLYTG